MFDSIEYSKSIADLISSQKYISCNLELQEYKENMEQLGEGKAIQAVSHKYFICL